MSSLTESTDQLQASHRQSAHEWLSIIDREYLIGYVREGGATVKVVVADPETRGHVGTALLERATEAGYVTASVDSRNCKIHLIHNLFNNVAADVDWLALARDFLRRELSDSGFAPPPGEALNLQAIAHQHGIDPVLMHREVLQMLTRRLLDNSELSREMRLAAVQLCLTVAEGTDQAKQMGANLLDWLHGDLRLISALKKALIFQKVNRHNARGLLTSLGSWARMAGRSGLVVTIDIARYLDAAADPELGLRHTKFATIEAYEVVRQFIDGTDEMEGTLLVFLTGTAFPTDEHRGMRVYEALRLRLYEDVRDRSRPNPLSPMVTLQ
jgi:hypothetical protein